ncbi:SDR family NAD(P)-dependent oxidoreductase [Rhizobiaceae bacterium]|nr:SDR family NAD(P)-dependent oxidoreductase [Rhizobiaceae bacterium]
MSDPRRHRIVITGATDGLGLLLARAYAKRGHTVLATGRKNLPDQAAHFEDDSIRYIRADQAVPERAAAQIDRALAEMGWDTVDLAILNAGIGREGNPASEPPAQTALLIDINLTSTILITHMLAPRLLAAEGQLALVGSSLTAGHPSFATYAATKAGLAGFARSLREEWRGRASVTLVHPGPTATTMHEKAGMKLGVARHLFMRPHRAARAIELAIRKNERVRPITRAYALRAGLAKPADGQL